MELFTQRLQIRSLALEDWQQLQKIFIDFAQSPSAPYDHALPTDDQGVIALTNHVLEQGLFFPGISSGYLGHDWVCVFS